MRVKKKSRLADAVTSLIRGLEFANSFSLSLSFSFFIYKWVSSIIMINTFFSKPSLRCPNMTALDEFIGKVHILSPQWPKFWECYLQPRLGSAIKMDDTSILSISKARIVLVTQPQHVPEGINNMDMTMESY
jgi:hypothetical protein